MAAGRIIRTCSLGLALVQAIPAAAQTSDLTEYVRARAADAAGIATVAAQGYGRALAATPDDPVIALRAYRQALMVGDVALAVRAVAVMEKAGVAPPDAALFEMAVALSAGDQPRAADAVKRLKGTPVDFLMPILTAWLAQARGLDGPAVLDSLHPGALARRYVPVQRALMLVARGKGEAAAVAVLPSLAGPGTDDARIDLARVLERDQARALLDSGGSDLRGVEKQWRGPRTADAVYGVSRLLLALASDLSTDRMATLTIALTRSALVLDPQEERARILLGEGLSGAGAEDLALATLGQVRNDSPFLRRAAVARVQILRDANRGEAALAEARMLAEGRSATVLDAERYAELLSATGRHDAAARVYATAIRLGGESSAELHLDHGAALDRAGRWEQALAQYRRAAELEPNRAEPLRALGTALLAHGSDSAEALRLLERARKLAPEDAEIADALGWAYVQHGDVARGVPLLEAATLADPAGTIANEHLGDAYWRLGRQFEARYAWRAAAIHAAPADAERIDRKLDQGLTGAS